MGGRTGNFSGSIPQLYDRYGAALMSHLMRRMWAAAVKDDRGRVLERGREDRDAGDGRGAAERWRCGDGSEPAMPGPCGDQAGIGARAAAAGGPWRCRLRSGRSMRWCASSASCSFRPVAGDAGGAARVKPVGGFVQRVGTMATNPSWRRRCRVRNGIRRIRPGLWSGAVRIPRRKRDPGGFARHGVRGCHDRNGSADGTGGKRARCRDDAVPGLADAHGDRDAGSRRWSCHGSAEGRYRRGSGRAARGAVHAW